jgi:pimeloyl-ACP methyl ester carboxylesterase
MTRDEVLKGLSRNGERYALTSLLSGKPYQVSQMSWHRRGSDAVIEISGLIDQAVLQLGRSSVRDRIVVTLAPDGRPKAYRRESGGQSLAIDFDGHNAHATLHDGTTFDLPASPESVIDGHAPILTALLIRLAWALRGGAEGRRPVFVAGQLLDISYSLTRRSDGVLASSLEELIITDEAGRMTGLAIPRQALEVREATAHEIATLERKDAPRMPRREPAAPARDDIDRSELEVAMPGGGSLHALVRRPRARPGRAALLLPGSGRIDRFGRSAAIDTGLGEIAEAVARAGFATLTADQPGAGRTPIGSSALERGFRAEIATASALLDVARASVEPASPVVLIGHSLGGLISLVLAGERPADIRALVLLSAPGRPIDAVIEHQIVWIGRRRGIAPDILAQQVAEHRGFMDAIRTIPDWTPETVPDRYLAQARLRSWLRELIDLDPAALIAMISCPVFLAQGGRDVQISVEYDFECLAAAAIATSHLEKRLYPELSHMLSAVPEGSGIEHYEGDRSAVDERLIHDVVAFLGRIDSS